MFKKTTLPIRRESQSEDTPAQAMYWPRLGTLQADINRLFEGLAPRFLDNPVWGAVQDWTVPFPMMDMSGNGDGYRLTFELPGLAADDIQLKLSDGMLTVSGEKIDDSVDEQEDRHTSERRWGSFRRSVRLPDDIDADKIVAEFANGVLTVRLPKSEAVKAAERKIAIKAA